SAQLVNVPEGYAYEVVLPEGEHSVIGSPWYEFCTSIIVYGYDAAGRKHLVHWHNPHGASATSYHNFLIDRIARLRMGLHDVNLVVAVDEHLEGGLRARELRRELNLDEVLILTRQNNTGLQVLASDQGIATYLRESDAVRRWRMNQNSVERLV